MPHRSHHCPRPPVKSYAIQFSPRVIYTDDQLNEFLLALDEGNVDVTEFEAKFIESNLSTYNFSLRQRQVIEQMIEKYGKRIGWS
jgi:hypothetical protein